MVTDPIRVLIADHYSAFRAGVRSFLSDAGPDIEVVGEADYDEAFLEAIEQMGPQVVLAGVATGQWKQGLKVLAQLGALQPAPGIVVMMAEADGAFIVPALLHGASGIVGRETTAEVLHYAIHQAARGNRFLASPIIETVIAYLRPYEAAIAGRALGPLGLEEKLTTLTDREREVFQLVAQGLTNREIADQFSLSIGTVKSHVGHILSKLGLQKRAQAALLVMEQALAQKTKPKEEVD